MSLLHQFKQPNGAGTACRPVNARAANKDGYVTAPKPNVPDLSGYVTRAEFSAVVERLAKLEALLASSDGPKRDRAAYMREYRAKNAVP